MDKLNAPIQLKEIRMVIAGLSSGKAPGPDGYSSEYYKTMIEDILDPLEKLYSNMMKGSGNTFTQESRLL